MKIVFIAGPFRGDGSRSAKEANVEIARTYVRKFIENNISFYSPHLNLDQEILMFEEDKSQYAITTNHTFLERCDILAVLPGWRDSSGTIEEIDLAQKAGKPVFYLEESDVFDKLREVIKTGN